MRIRDWSRDDHRLFTHLKPQLSIAVIEFLDEDFRCFRHANVSNHFVPLTQKPARSFSFATGRHSVQLPLMTQREIGQLLASIDLNIDHQFDLFRDTLHLELPANWRLY